MPLNERRKLSHQHGKSHCCYCPARTVLNVSKLQVNTKHPLSDWWPLITRLKVVTHFFVWCTVKSTSHRKPGPHLDWPPWHQSHGSSAMGHNPIITCISPTMCMGSCYLPFTFTPIGRDHLRSMVSQALSLAKWSHLFYTLLKGTKPQGATKTTNSIFKLNDVWYCCKTAAYPPNARGHQKNHQGCTPNAAQFWVARLEPGRHLYAFWALKINKF